MEAQLKITPERHARMLPQDEHTYTITNICKPRRTEAANFVRQSLRLKHLFHSYLGDSLLGSLPRVLMALGGLIPGEKPI